MKTHTGITLLVLASLTNAFSLVSVRLPPPKQRLSTATLDAHRSNNVPVPSIHATKTFVALLLGAACMMGPVVAVAETSLDFSLPTYDTNMQGFGDGKEAILNTRGRADRTDPGANEQEKQVDAMRKAEAARVEAKLKKKAELKALEEEANRRAAERKARDAERLKNIWN
jgi:hypothetical protein